MTILRSDFLGYDTAEEITERSIRNRYLVLRLIIHDAPVYIHNVYAPVKADERVLFFELLLSHTIESAATHLVFGDFNTPLDPAVDASSGVIRHEMSRLVCLEWLSQLGVVDAWRIHHPTEKSLQDHYHARIVWITSACPKIYSIWYTKTRKIFAHDMQVIIWHKK